MQELIIQNFVPKKGTDMAGAPEPPFSELLWTIAVARLLFGPAMNIQAPPNLSPGWCLLMLLLGLQIPSFSATGSSRGNPCHRSDTMHRGLSADMMAATLAQIP